LQICARVAEDHHRRRFRNASARGCGELRAVANQVAPGVPTAVTAMGWKPLVHKTSFDLADIVLSDTYPLPGAFGRLAEWAEEMRRWSAGKAFMGVLALTRSYNNVANDPSKWLDVSYMRSGFYIYLAYGARGVWFFGDPAGTNGRTGVSAQQVEAYYRSTSDARGTWTGRGSAVAWSWAGHDAGTVAGRRARLGTPHARPGTRGQLTSS
jgi:hypothetical protein